MKIFVHNEKTFYYVVKDISWKEVGNKEMAVLKIEDIYGCLVFLLVPCF
mgnify:CR=1 FL=1